MQKQWRCAPVPQSAAELADSGYPAAVANLLARRGVTDAEAARRFLQPSTEQLIDPFRLFRMEQVVERLLIARQGREKVAIVGDYDVDGVTATALLIATLRSCGMASEAILPHRMREGYGFQPVHVERARALGCQLIVTVDCGATAVAAVELARELGIDVIVTDHHLPDQDLPFDTPQINPRQPQCQYPNPELTGVGLALKLAAALAQRCGKELDQEALLRITALGTIADLAPLTGENRAIVALGLEALPRTRSLGLKALIRQAGLNPPFSAADVGFRLAPRLNAAGRLDSPEQALELLLTRRPERAAELAQKLEAWNRERQAHETRVVEEARAQFLVRSSLPHILVAWSPEWHRGVVGIAAGRLAREFYRPTVLLSIDGACATGSGRSVPGLELHSFLGAWRNSLERFGGHSKAVGLTVATERLESLRGEWEIEAQRWSPDLLVRCYEYEVELSAADLSSELALQLARLEPHGEGNPRPLLRLGPLKAADSVRHFGNGHLEVQATSPEGEGVRLVGWGWGDRAAALEGSFEVLGHLEQDRYRRDWVVRLVDSRPI